MNAQWQIFMDFDGTITEEDTLVLLLDRFAPKHWWDIENALLQGTGEEKSALQAEMDLLNTTWEEAVEFLRSRVKLRAGLPEFLEGMRSGQIPVTVLSGGFTEIISQVFSWHQIDLPVFANSLNIVDRHWQVVPAETPRLRGICNHCKSWHLTRPVHPVKTVFVGDGSTDRCAAAHADRVYARDYLVEYCRRNQIPHQEFHDFHDLLQDLKECCL